MTSVPLLCKMCSLDLATAWGKELVPCQAIRTRTECGNLKFQPRTQYASIRDLLSGYPNAPNLNAWPGVDPGGIGLRRRPNGFQWHDRPEAGGDCSLRRRIRRHACARIRCPQIAADSDPVRWPLPPWFLGLRRRVDARPDTDEQRVRRSGGEDRARRRRRQLGPVRCRNAGLRPRDDGRTCPLHWHRRTDAFRGPWIPDAQVRAGLR